MKLIARAMKRISRWRYICKIDTIDDGDFGGGHMDSHADTCTGGPEFVLLDGTTSKLVEVSGFSGEFDTIKDIPIGTCVTAYDDPETGTTTLLMFGEHVILWGQTYT